MQAVYESASKQLQNSFKLFSSKMILLKIRRNVTIYLKILFRTLQ